jgi:hypothetical protein
VSGQFCEIPCPKNRSGGLASHTNDRFLQVSEFVYITRQQKNKLTEIASGDFVPQSPSQ